MGGTDLFDTLDRTKVVEGLKGTWKYIASDNKYSFLFEHLMESGPREYMASNVFLALGIDNSEISWRRNSDGKDVSTFGTYLSAYDMAKFGQLYLQKGMSAPGKKPLV